MKKLQFTILGIMVFFMWGLIFAQQSISSQFGVGTAISDIDDITSTIFFPITISSYFRIEPEIRFMRKSSSSDRESKENDFNNTSTSENTSTSKHFHIGIGIFPVIPKDSYNLYLGVRLGYIRISSSHEYNSISSSIDYYHNYKSKVKESTNGYYIAPAIGGEYFLSDYFSLGGEVQVEYTSLKGEEKNEGDNQGITDRSSSSTSARALILVRFYFSRRFKRNKENRRR